MVNGGKSYDRRFASWFISPPHSTVQRASSQCAILTRCAEGQLSVHHPHLLCRGPVVSFRFSCPALLCIGPASRMGCVVFRTRRFVAWAFHHNPQWTRLPMLAPLTRPPCHCLTVCGCEISPRADSVIGGDCGCSVGRRLADSVGSDTQIARICGGLLGMRSPT
jgi:hypothetical protein